MSAFTIHDSAPEPFFKRGGCSCKVPSSKLKNIISVISDSLPAAVEVGPLVNDDAAVCRLSGDSRLLASVDFQNPTVADPTTAGYIAAANALSDVFAMGSAPAYTLGILVVAESDPNGVDGREMLAGMAQAVRDAGGTLVGGHTIQGKEPLCGLVVLSETAPATIKLNAGARPGDVLILTKPLGIGVTVAGARFGYTVPENLAECVATMRQLNTVGVWLGTLPDVHGMTDVTGFGLNGHACEVAEASDVCIHIDAAKVPILKGARLLAVEGIAPELAYDNLADRETVTEFRGEWSHADRILFADPQTNGGLLIAAAPEAADGIIERLRADGCADACGIGVVVGPRPDGKRLVLEAQGDRY